MRAVGVDFGSRRIGIAICDSLGTIATPFETIKRVGDRTIEHGRIEEIVLEIGAEIIVIGMPYSLDGSEGPAARLIRSEVKGLRKRLAIPVHTIDERFTTVTAHDLLNRGGTKGSKKRDVVDQVAAAVLLQHWLDSRPSGLDPGLGH